MTVNGGYFRGEIWQVALLTVLKLSIAVLCNIKLREQIKTGRPSSCKCLTYCVSQGHDAILKQFIAYIDAFSCLIQAACFPLAWDYTCTFLNMNSHHPHLFIVGGGWYRFKRNGISTYETIYSPAFIYEHMTRTYNQRLQVSAGDKRKSLNETWKGIWIHRVYIVKRLSWVIWITSETSLYPFCSVPKAGVTQVCYEFLTTKGLLYKTSDWLIACAL